MATKSTFGMLLKKKPAVDKPNPLSMDDMPQKSQLPKKGKGMSAYAGMLKKCK